MKDANMATKPKKKKVQKNNPNLKGIKRPHIKVLGEYSLHYFVRHLANKGCGRNEAMHVLNALGLKNIKSHTVGATISVQTLPGHKRHENGVKLDPKHTARVDGLISKAKDATKKAKADKATKNDMKKAARKTEVKPVEVEA